MASFRSLTISEFVPTLEGQVNWVEWCQSLEIFLDSKHKNLWDILTGTYPRPADIATLETLINPPPTHWTSNAAAQDEWEFLDSMAQAGICATISTHMLLYILDCKTSFQVFEILRSSYDQEMQTTSVKVARLVNSNYKPTMDADVFLKQWRVNMVEVQMALFNADRPSNLFCCHMFLNATSDKPAHWDTEALDVLDSVHSLFGQEMPQTPCDKVVHFTQFKYKPDMKAKEFVAGWRLSMQEVQRSFSPFDCPSALFCYHMFLNAVSANPACYPWFKTVHVYERDFSFVHFEEVYLDFLEFEDCRHKCFETGTSIHDQHTANIETRQRSPEYQPGKVYHITEMAQYADKMRRESYRDDGLVYHTW